MEEAYRFDLAYLLSHKGLYKAIVPPFKYSLKKLHHKFILYPNLGERFFDIKDFDLQYGPSLVWKNPGGFVYDGLTKKMLDDYQRYGFYQSDPNFDNFVYNTSEKQFYNIDSDTFVFWFDPLFEDANLDKLHPRNDSQPFLKIKGNYGKKDGLFLWEEFPKYIMD